MSELRQLIEQVGSPGQADSLFRQLEVTPQLCASQHGKLPGQRYEMNARGEGFDPLLCRAPHSDEDGRLRDVRNAAYGCFGFGAPIVRSHLSERPLLP